MIQNHEKLAKTIDVTLDRSRKSIEQWLNAYIWAENRVHPTKASLIDVYEYALLDNHLSAIIRNRKQLVIGEKWQIVDDNGEFMEDETTMLKTAWFRDTMDLIMDSQFFGYSMIELGDLGADKRIHDITQINRRNVRPETREILKQPYDIAGFNIDEPIFKDYYIQVNGTEGLGLLLKSTPGVIYKRFALAAWTEHAEKFSLPFLQGKTNTQDPEAVEKLTDALTSAGRNMMAITDHGDEITTITTPGSDAHQIYNQLIERINSENSKLVQGQTMTTDDGSSRSQAEVHENVAGSIAQADREFTENIINDELLPRLTRLGYPFDGLRFAFDTTREHSLDERVKVFTMLLPHYGITPEQIKETFGVDVETKSIVVPGNENTPGK